jgi:hypothetical protein
MAMQNANKPVVTESAPVDWTATQEVIAKDALTVLLRNYPGYRWAAQWSETVGNALGVLIIRILDLPTKTVFLINPKDIDRDNMRCAMRAGGLLLEALGLRVGRAKGDDFRGLKQTPSGLIVPDYAAVPETNPGYEAIKKDFTKLHNK